MIKIAIITSLLKLYCVFYFIITVPTEDGGYLKKLMGF
jgi:hypothetical protein